MLLPRSVTVSNGTVFAATFEPRKLLDQNVGLVHIEIGGIRLACCATARAVLLKVIDPAWRGWRYGHVHLAVLWLISLVAALHVSLSTSIVVQACFLLVACAWSIHYRHQSMLKRRPQIW